MRSGCVHACSIRIQPSMCGVYKSNANAMATLDASRMTTRAPEKREKDALRYLALCANNPIAFRQAIDTVPESSIRRICDAVLNATKGDVRRKLTPAQRRMCDKYKRSIAFLVSPTKPLKAKRLLLRSAKKQVGGSVFVPLMLQAALDTLGSALIPSSTAQA